MTWLKIMYYVISAILGVITAGAALGIRMRSTHLAYKEAKEAEAQAKTEAEAAKAAEAKARAREDLLAVAKQFICAAEIAFEGFDKMMKAQGSSAGAMKKDNVFTKLQAYALQNNYDFDVDEWSAKIDELVAYTKSVNTKA